jgi:hypothetical protein
MSDAGRCFRRVQIATGGLEEFQMTALSSNEGQFAKSTTTSAPLSASAKPSP